MMVNCRQSSSSSFIAVQEIKGILHGCYSSAVLLSDLPDLQGHGPLLRAGPYGTGVAWAASTGRAVRHRGGMGRFYGPGRTAQGWHGPLLRAGAYGTGVAWAASTGRAVRHRGGMGRFYGPGRTAQGWHGPLLRAGAYGTGLAWAASTGQAVRHRGGMGRFAYAESYGQGHTHRAGL